MNADDTVVMPAALAADYRRLRANLKRLAQVATLAERRWLLHEEQCELCQEEEDEAEAYCAQGVALYFAAEAFNHSVLTVKGQMIWE